MYDVIVIKEGYSKPVEKGAVRAGGTITLLKGPHNILIDTGSPWDRDLLLNGLKANGLSPDEITYVVCSHGHSDHVGNLNLFHSSMHIVSYDICKGDEYILHDFAQGIPFEIDDCVEIWPTPGHTGSDVSVLVRGTKHGTVAITGDLFEKFEDLDEPDIWQFASERPELQQQSRIDILREADFIVPGHGPMFRVPADLRKQMRVVMMSMQHEKLEEAGGYTVSSSVHSECVIVETD